VFILAALVDYYCIQLITAMKWTIRSHKYFVCLVTLLAASIGSHLVGCIGFWSNTPYLLQLYDTLAVFLLVAELGVFVIYGLDILRGRGVVRSGVGR